MYQHAKKFHRFFSNCASLPETWFLFSGVPRLNWDRWHFEAEFWYHYFPEIASCQNVIAVFSGTCSSVSSISTDGDKFVQRKPRNIVEETFQHVVDDVDHKERDGRRIERNPRTVKSENGVFLHGHSRTAPAYLNGNEKAMNGNSSRRYVEPVRFTSKSLLTETRSKATKNVACEKDKQGRTFTAGSERLVYCVISR